MGGGADGNWERDLDRFREFPKGRCVFEADHGTDMYKVKEKIGDWCAIKGDVPAALLACRTPDDVYVKAKSISRFVRNRRPCAQRLFACAPVNSNDLALGKYMPFARRIQFDSRRCRR